MWKALMRMELGKLSRVFFFLLSLCASSLFANDRELGPSPSPRYELNQSSDVDTLVDGLLLQMDQELPDDFKPVLLVVHPASSDWGRLHQELVVAMSRFGIEVEGISVDSPNMTAAQREAIEALPGPEGLSFGLTVADAGEDSGTTLRRVAAFFGMQRSGEHFRKLRESYRGEGSYRFKWLTTVPKGFGGNKQKRYLIIASVNTLSFALANKFGVGTAELLVFGLTYLFQAGQDYVNYLRRAGRSPRWQWDPKTGSQVLIGDVHQTFSRMFFFLVTWGIVGVSNLAIMMPIMIKTGIVAPILWRVFTNSLLGVFSFAPLEAIFANQRNIQLNEEKTFKSMMQDLRSRWKSLSREQRRASLRDAMKVRAKARRAESIQLNGRTYYYGGAFPFIKNFNLLSDGLASKVLLVIGGIGSLVDFWQNGTRLNWFGWKLSPAPRSEPPSEIEDEIDLTAEASSDDAPWAHPCVTQMVLGSRTRIDTVKATFSRPHQE